MHAHIHSRFDHNQQRYVMNEIQQPANAFEWRRFVVEEDARRNIDVPVAPVRVRNNKTANRVLENQRARRKLAKSISAPISR
jgi:hypothetical protein